MDKTKHVMKNMLPSDRRRLDREATRLIAEHKMPTLETVLAAVAETRQKFQPLILSARAGEKAQLKSFRSSVPGRNVENQMLKRGDAMLEITEHGRALVQSPEFAILVSSCVREWARDGKEITADMIGRTVVFSLCDVDSDLAHLIADDEITRFIDDHLDDVNRAGEVFISAVKQFGAVH